MRAYEKYEDDGIIVEHLPSPYARLKRSWVAIGAEADIRHLLKTWEVVLRFNLHEIPETLDIYWDLANKLLQHQRRGNVRVVNGIVEIDRRQLKELRDGVDWLAGYLCDEHQDAYLEYVPHLNCHVRRDDAPQNLTERDEARRAVHVCDDIVEIAANNVVRLFDEVIS